MLCSEQEVAARLAAVDLKMVDDLLLELGLDVCKDTMVGTIFFKGISGGQKRRLSIAIELLSSPKLLLLDEPTSGLVRYFIIILECIILSLKFDLRVQDSAAALQVVQLMKRLARSKREVAVLCTLHQPSQEAYYELDTASFLATGRMVWFGPTGEPLKNFLASKEYPVPNSSNVADYVMSLINKDFAAAGLVTADLDVLVTGFKELRAQWEDGKKANAASADVEVLAVVPVAMAQRANFFARFMVLCGRDFKEVTRDPGILGVRLAMYTMLSILIALMFLGLGDDLQDKDIVARVSVLFFVAAFMVFMSVAVLPFFVMQRAVFITERCNGAYNVPEYCLAKFFTSLPGLLLLSGISSVVIVVPTGLNSFGLYFLNLFLSLLWGEAFMALMAALVPHYIIGIALAAGVFGFFMLCEGFFKLKNDIPDYLIWGYYIAPHTYSFRTFMYGEFHPIDALDSMQYSDGDAVLDFYDMPDVKPAQDMLVLFLFTVLTQLVFATVLYKFHTGLR
jgi:hypothetical protein